VTRHDELMGHGPREAPEPETAEQRSKRVGWGAAGGSIAGGGIVLAKFGGLAKVFLWLFAWHAVANGWRIGGWIGLAVVVTLIAALVVRHRREVRP
jgi:hypothetical protein